MKKIHPYLLLFIFCATSIATFGQSTFTPATNLQIDVITNAGLEVSWTQGTNVLDYSIEFTLDGVSMGVSPIAASNSYASYYNPPSGMVGVNQIEVTLISRGINDGGALVAVPIKAFITVDEVYEYEDFEIFCVENEGVEHSKAYVKSIQFETYYSLPCICQVDAKIKDDSPHPYYNAHFWDYMAVLNNQNTIVYLSDVILFMNNVDLLQQEECEIFQFNDQRTRVGKKEHFDQEAIGEGQNIYTYQNLNQVIIKNLYNVQDLQLHVLDITGKVIPVSTSFLSDEIRFDKSSLSNGVYFIKVVGSSKILYTDKVLVE